RVPIAVSVDGIRASLTEGAVAVADLEVEVHLRPFGSGTLLEWLVRNPGRRTLHPNRVAVHFELRPALVLEHGWQSWSPVRACPPGAVQADRRHLPAWRRAEYFGEPDRAGRVVVGEPFLVDDTGATAFLGASRHLAAVEAGPEGLAAVALLEALPIEPGEAVDLHPVWFATGDPGEMYSELATLWGRAEGARVNAAAPFGWCSWYQHEHRFSPAELDRTLALATGHGIDVVQVDDGYAAEVGDWTRPATGWPPVAEIAGRIAAAGITPGLWLAPFVALEGGRLVVEHPDWVLHDRAGHPVRAMHNPIYWGGWAVALDTTHPAVLDHVRRQAAALRDAGFGYLKLDFLYAAALDGRRSVTRAAALRMGLEAIRDGAGESVVLLGSGAPFGPAVGVVDAMRVSPDVSVRWGARRPTPGLVDAASCARTAITTSVLRAPLHRRLWANDPDCVLLRPTDTELEPWQRRALAATSAGLGGWVVLSDDLDTYGDAEWALVDDLRGWRARAQGPADLVDPFSPTLTVRCGDLALATGVIHDGDRHGASPGRSLVRATGATGFVHLSERERAAV
ncbi:MAG TPA: glycoside hydrolase family 36 protein, partial [Acidimicrobiales bacterium]|nr:glycoside hydrolase family 36 protein [Acidimicrobiales bacterium]